MSTLTRVTGKVFAGEAEAQTGGIGQFGSAATGTPNPTTDVATIQALNAYKEGWGSAVVSNRNYPPLEEVNGVLKTISYQTCYLLQEGIPTYDSGTNYSATSIVKAFNQYGILFYLSKHDDNQGHNPESSPNDWEQVYFQTGYEDNITANRSIALTGNVTGSVSYQLTDPNKYNLSINASISSSFLSLLYPVGSFYIGTMSTCPIAALIPGSTWNLISAGLTLQQADSAHPVGTEIPAGLPNITGNFKSPDDRSHAPSGVFTQENVSNFNCGDQNGNGKKIMLDASRASSIYGSSDTVQPPALAVNIWQRTA